MKKNVSLNISDIISPILSFLRRFHTIIFFLLVSAGLFIAIVILLPIINLSSAESQTTGQVIDGSFDQDTINRLRNTSTSSPFSPGQRMSPFVE